MATIPRLESASLIAQPARLARQQPGYGLARGLDTVAQNVGIVDETLQRRDNMRDIAFVAQQQAADRLAINERLNQLVQEAPPDGSGVNDAIQQEIEQRRQAGLKLAPSPMAASALDQQFAELRTSFGVRAQTFEATQRGQYTISQLNDAVGLEAAHLAFNPDDFDAALARTDQTTLALAKQAGMNPAVLSEYRKKAYADLAVSKLHGELLRDPVTAYADIASGKYDKYFAGAPEKLNSLLSSTLSQFTEIQNQAYTQQRREKKAAEEATFKAGLKLLQTPGANMSAFLDNNYATLSPEAYKYISVQKDKGPLVGNRGIYSSLLLESTSYDNSHSARQHFLAGDLTEAEFDRITSNATADSNSVYKFGEKYITMKIAPTFGETDFSGKQDRTAAALDKWRQWTIDHPNAPDKEARLRYIEIGDEFKMLSLQESMITLGLPRYHVGGKDDLNLSATFKATEDALAAKEITQDEYDAEQILINEWRQVLTPPVEPPPTKVK